MYLEKCFTQIYKALYGDAMLVSLLTSFVFNIIVNDITNFFPVLFPVSFADDNNLFLSNLILEYRNLI